MTYNKESNNTHTDEFKKEFGQRLRSLRKKRGYSTEQVLIALNLPRSTYAAWELGKRVPLTKSLSKLASFLDTNVDYLMLKTDNPIREHQNDLKIALLKASTLTWDGKPINEKQAETISALIEAYVKNSQKDS